MALMKYFNMTWVKPLPRKYNHFDTVFPMQIFDLPSTSFSISNNPHKLCVFSSIALVPSGVVLSSVKVGRRHNLALIFLSYHLNAINHIFCNSDHFGKDLAL